MNDLKVILEDVKSVIRQAGSAVLRFYNEGCEVEYKGDNSPLTQADLESNRIIVSELKKFGYGILSEESADDSSRLNKKRVWIIDPMDGTKDFVNRTGDFTIMVALVEDGKPILGIIYRPAKDNLFYAFKDGGAFVEIEGSAPIRLQVSVENDFRRSRMLSSRFHESELENKMIKDLGIKEKITYGSSIKVCKIAQGDAEINFNPAPKTWEWDVCASDIILAEAGGRMTDTLGQDFIYNKKDPRNNYGYVATNGVLHEDVVNYINSKKQITNNK